MVLDTSRDPVSLDSTLDPDSESPLVDFVEDAVSAAPEQTLLHGQMLTEIDRLLEVLDEDEAFVVAQRFGLADGRIHLAGEIAPRMGVSRQRVQRIEQEALAKLRAGDDAERLRDYLS